MKCVTMMLALIMLVASGASGASEQVEPEVRIDQVRLEGEIQAANITFTLAMRVITEADEQRIDLVSGDLVVVKVTSPSQGYRLHYDRKARTYALSFPQRGTYDVQVMLAVRPEVVVGGEWRQATISVPASRLRRLQVTCDRSDLKVQFPGAMRLERQVTGDKLVVTALQGAGRPFVVRWQPRVQELDAKLVATGRINTIVTAAVGVLRLDSLFHINLSQGKLTDLTFTIPDGLGITQVQGQHIQDWRIEEATDHGKLLTVVLSRPQTKAYTLRLLAEMPLPNLPTTINTPAPGITPGIIPSTNSGGGGGSFSFAGQLAIGTHSAIQLVIDKTVGLSQIDGSAFERVALDAKHLRALPANKTFFYTFSAPAYQLAVKLADIVPSYDATQRLVLDVREDDLVLEGQIELDVRDAPIRALNIDIPRNFAVSAVGGQALDDYSVIDADDGDGRQTVAVRFSKPILGRTLIALRLELGRGPLGELQQVGGVTVQGAKTERGYMVVRADDGIEIADSTAKALRSVHTASVPMRIDGAQLAYRFKASDWELTLQARKKPAGVRVESIHIVALGDGVSYGSVAVNYSITGSPVDELHLIVPAQLQNVDFIGRDVRRWTRDEDRPQRWTVKLRRKVIGDYNLGVSYTQQYKPGDAILVGAVHCDDVSTQRGHVVVASHLDLKLTSQPPTPTPTTPTLMAIDRQEVPANYRLLVNAPILAAYQYVGVPQALSIVVDTYEPAKLLPAIIDLVTATTELSMPDDDQSPGATTSRITSGESVTRIRYRVKNATSQFMALTLPKGATLWSTRLVEQDLRGAEKLTRIAASFDSKSGQLLVPLKRLHNPNAPITIELEFGQVHPQLTYGTALQLATPQSSTPATFQTWRVNVGKDMAVLAGAGATMVPRGRVQTKGDLSLVMRHMGESWRWVFQDRLGTQVSLSLAGAVLVAILVAWLVRQRVLRMLVVAMLLVACAALGMVATTAPVFAYAIAAPEQVQSIDFSQAVNVADTAALTVSVRVLPAWRAHATVLGAIVFPAVALVLLLAATRLRRWRMLLLPVAMTLLIFAAAQFSPLTPVLGHLLAWGIPAILLGVLVVRLSKLIRLRTKPTTAAPATATILTLMLAGVTALSGCTSRQSIDAPADTTSVSKLNCTMTVEQDSVAVDMRLQINSAGPTKIELLDSSAILLSPRRVSDDLTLSEAKGKHILGVARGGRYDVQLKFLAPLAAADVEQRRSFKLPLPEALTNYVRFSVPG